MKCSHLIKCKTKKKPFDLVTSHFKVQANAIYNKIKYSMTTGCYKIYPINIYIGVSITIFKFSAQETLQFMFYILLSTQSIQCACSVAHSTENLFFIS